MKYKGKLDFEETPQVNGVDMYAVKVNLAASVAPGATDDSAAGYAVGSRWIDTTADKEYVCLDATAAAAVWTETTGAGSGDTLPVVDTTAIAKGSADATKLVRLEVDGLTTATTRVVTVPDQDLTLIDTADARLSDSRAPTNHASDHTDGTDDIQDATAGQKGVMTAAFATKLDGIEALADVTDATNVTAAGAVMDSELIQASAGAGDAGKPIKLDAAGHVDASMVNDADIDHANVGNVTSDQHHAQAHDLGGADHNSATLAQLNAKVSDATLIDTADSRLSDARTPTAHALGGAEHSADTLANLNAKVSNATLIDTADARLSDERTASAVATTGADVNVDAAAPPTTGQILKATSATTATWQAEAGGGSAVTVEDEGTPLTTDATKLNFAGAGVTVTEPVTDEMLVTIPGGGGIEQDLQSVSTSSTTSTGSATWVDMVTMTLTTSNTASKDYVCHFNATVDNGTTNKVIDFRFMVDGVADTNSARSIDIKTAGVKIVVSLLTTAASLATAKIIKVQYQTSGGTLTAHQRCMVIQGIS